MRRGRRKFSPVLSFRLLFGQQARADINDYRTTEVDADKKGPRHPANQTSP
jgi:hypothetical protein